MMKKILLLAVLTLTSTFCFADDTVFLLTGMVRDKTTSAQLIDAEVMMYDLNDSLIAQGKAHEWEWDRTRRADVETARFYLGFTKGEIARAKEFRLRIAAEEHDTLWQLIDLRDVGKRELKRDLGTLYLSRQKTVNLDEVTVTATKVKFVHRGDTIVYKADAFELAEGSMLDALVKQLPGVELKDGGEIFVNGKKVESLLLNGKDFFKGNNQLMLDNLGAYTVKNIEVYKKQTDQAKFLGLDSEDSKQLTMDVQLKKEYIGGWVANIEAGGGTEDRYLGRLFAMHFNALSQFTLLGNMNNLNDERRPTNDDSWEQPEYRPNGTKQFKQIGLNYSTENEDGTKKVSGAMTFASQRNLFESESNSTNFLQTMNTQGKSQNTSLSRNYTFNTDHNLLWQNNWLSATISPSFAYHRGKNEGGGFSETRNELQGEETGALINRSLSESFGSDNGLRAGVSLRTTMKIPKTSDAIELFASFRHDNGHSEADGLDIIQYGDVAMQPSARNTQTTERPNHKNDGEAGAYYLLRFNDKMSLKFVYNYHFARETKTSAFYLGQLVGEHSGDYTMENLRNVARVFDPTNSNTSLEKYSEHRFASTFDWRITKRLNLTVNAEISSLKNSLDYNQNAKDYQADFKETSLSGGEVSLYWSKEKEGNYTLWEVEYSLNRQTPQLMSMIEVENTRDPLSRYLANPDLKSSVSNSLLFYFHKSVFNKYSFNAYTYGTKEDRAFLSGYTYDTSTGLRTFKTYNVDGNWRLSAHTSFSYELFSWLSLNSNMNYTHTKSYNMIGENALTPSKFSMQTDIYNPELGLQAKLGGKVTLDWSSSVKWQDSHSANKQHISANYTAQQHKLQGNFRLAKGWSANTSISLYNRSGCDDPRMNRTEWIWNGHVTKSMLGGRLLCSLTAYDLLHQIQTVNYRITPDARVETFTNSIPRYVLLHMQYKLNIKPKKKLAETVRYY